MSSIYDELNKTLYKENATGTSSSNTVNSDNNDPTLFSSDNIVELGQFRNLSVKSVILTVTKSDDIQKAINKVSELGGGEVRLGAATFFPIANIAIPSNVSLIGSGRDVTIIDFAGSAYGVVMVGTVGTFLQNIQIKNLTIQNSNNTAGLDVDYSKNWSMENVRITSCDQVGIRIQRSNNYLMSNVVSDNNTGVGWSFVGENTTGHYEFTLINCSADNNSAAGFSFSGTGVGMRSGSLIACTSLRNSAEGFVITNGVKLDFIGCRAGVGGLTAEGNDTYGFHLNSGGTYSLVDCEANYNTAAGVFLGANAESAEINIVALSGFPNTAVLLDANNIPVNLIGAIIDSGSNVAATDLITNLYDGDAQTSGIYGGTVIQERKIFQMQNVSGGALLVGDVVIIASDASGMGITTTTSAGNNKVFGMVLGTIVNNGYGYVLVAGKTTKLKVNGTTDIAVGDWLSTYTVAGISGKASAGHMAFAIALEAYTTNDSSGVIDALLVSPRLI